MVIEKTQNTFLLQFRFIINNFHAEDRHENSMNQGLSQARPNQNSDKPPPLSIHDFGSQILKKKIFTVFAI